MTYSWKHQLPTEFLGTFFLVFTVSLSVSAKADLAGLAIGSVLAVMIYAGGHVSGAHYNPAVTVALLISEQLRENKIGLDGVTALLYIVVQLAGGVTAALLAFGLTGIAPAAAPGAAYSVGSAFGAEVLYTFALCFVVINVATSAGTTDGYKNGNSFYGFAIGFTVFAGAIAVGGISGGCFNPAVATGLIIGSVAAGSAVTGTGVNLAMYWSSELFAALLAASIYWVTVAGDRKSEKKVEESQSQPESV